MQPIEGKTYYSGEELALMFAKKLRGRFGQKCECDFEAGDILVCMPAGSLQCPVCLTEFELLGGKG